MPLHRFPDHLKSILRDLCIQWPEGIKCCCASGMTWPRTCSMQICSECSLPKHQTAACTSRLAALPIIYQYHASLHAALICKPKIPWIPAGKIKVILLRWQFVDKLPAAGELPEFSAASLARRAARPPPGRAALRVASTAALEPA